jgi:hypothetical protein
VLLAAGIVVWLASLGLFKDARTIAFILGGGTLALMLLGWWTTLKTRFSTPGKAITLLACLVMPLNLWFCHAHGLVTLDGRLWVLALLCCALYATTALVLRDSTFVHVLMMGVAGTGLLLLQDAGRLLEWVAPAMLLVGLGVVGIHAERGFPSHPGHSFSRQTFGSAFFSSGHFLLGLGLLLVLVAHLIGLFHKPLFPYEPIAVPVFWSDRAYMGLALGLILLGAWSYLYSDLVVVRGGGFLFPAAFTLLWAELVALRLLNLELGAEVAIFALAGTALVLHLMVAGTARSGVGRTAAPVAMLLSILPVLIGVMLHLRATHRGLYENWPYTVGWWFVGAMAATAIASRVGAHVHRNDNPRTCRNYFFLTAIASLVGAAGLLAMLGVRAWSGQAPLLMLIPLAYISAATVYRNESLRSGLASAGHAGTVVMLISVVLSALYITPRVVEPLQGTPINLLLAMFFAQACIFYVIHSTLRKRGASVVMAVLCGAGAAWQMLSYYKVPAEAYLLSFAGAGVALLLIGRATRRSGGPEDQDFSPSTRAGNALMTVACVLGVLFTLDKLFDDKVRWTQAILMTGMVGLSLMASSLNPATGWRSGHVLMAVINAGAAFLLFNVLTDFSGWRKLEIMLVGAGTICLLLGHIGWLRERDARTDGTSLNLSLGSLLVGVPLLTAVAVQRFGWTINVTDELILLVGGMLLLISGVMLQIKSTTLTGAAMLGLHLAMLVATLGMRSNLRMGQYLAIGGAGIFLLGLVLSLWREHLLRLPQLWKERKGVFRVLGWG